MVSENKITEYSKVLPEFMRKEIAENKKTSDQKLKLLSRLMLKKSLKDTGSSNLIDKWERDPNNKPFIPGWNSFNISHSGEIVAFAYKNGNIGIDLEKRDKINYEEMLEYLHPEEQKFISVSEQMQQTFFEIWVKKEAILKALGVGLMDGLAEFSCINQSVFHEGNEWHFHPIWVHSDYVCYICSLDKGEKMNVIPFNPSIDHE